MTRTKLQVEKITKVSFAKMVNGQHLAQLEGGYFRPVIVENIIKNVEDFGLDTFKEELAYSNGQVHSASTSYIFRTTEDGEENPLYIRGTRTYVVRYVDYKGHAKEIGYIIAGVPKTDDPEERISLVIYRINRR